MAILLLAFASNDASADCPAAPIADPDDMVVSFLALNGTQAAPGTLMPSTVKEGMLVYDDTAGKLKICDGTNWVDVGSGSGTDTLASLSCASGEIAKYNGTAWACAADGGGSTTSPGFFAHKNSVDQTVIAGAWTLLNWTTESYDITNNFDLATDRFTPNVAGRYQINLNGYCNGTQCSVMINKNSADCTVSTGYISQGYNSGSAKVAQANAVVDMNGTTDYVTGCVHNAGSTTIYGGTYTTNFSGGLMGGGGGGSSQWTTIGNDLHYGTGGVAIGQASAPDASAALELESTAKGFLPPRMTTVQRDAIASPATGLMIFNTTTGQYQFWNGSAWSGLGSASVPTGTIAAFALTTCPSGWTEYTAARGRFLRGIDNGAGNDPSGTRAPGNAQADVLKDHTHNTAFYMRGIYESGGVANGMTTVPTGSTYDTAGVTTGASTETRPKNVAVLFCQYSGSGGGGGATTLAGLTDVDVSAVANGRVLTYNSTTSKWEAVTPSGGTPAPSNGYVQFNSSGAFGGDTNLFWDNTNKRLGIGTAAPKGRLDVFGPTVSNATNFYFGGSDQTLGNETRLYLSPIAVWNQQKIAIISEASNTWGRGKLHFALNPANDSSDATKANAVMTLLDSGNVGVGATSPAAKLHVIGGALLDEQAGDGSAIKITERGTGFGAKLVWLDENQIASAAVTKTANDSLGFYTNGAQSSGQEKLVITAAGNVGIGTTTPNSPLTVAKNQTAAVTYGQVENSSSTGWAAWTATSDAAYINIGAAGSGTANGAIGYIQTIGPYPIVLMTSNGERMRIAANGNVGIGTASPGQKLTVAGTIESTSGGVKFPDGSTQTTSAGIPAGAVMAFDLTTCPAGWVEYTAARGRFLRGIDNGAGNDPDGTRAPGNAQLDELKNHTHTYVQSQNNNGDYASTNQEAANKGVVAGVTDATGGAETRPKNVAVLFCRKN